MPIRLTVSLRPPKHLGGGLKFLLLLPAFRNVREILQKKTASIYYFLNKYYVHILG